MSVIIQQPFPENLPVWIDLGKTSSKQESGKVILEASNGVLLSFDKSDVLEIEGRILVRNSAEVNFFVNEEKIELSGNSCSSVYLPNQCYLDSTSCQVILLMCSYCCYDGVGRYKKSKTKVCGVCVESPI